MYIPRRDKELYFIRSESGPIKIGISADAESRLETIQSMSPVKLTLVAKKQACFLDECQIHKMFEKQRLHGEWFDSSEELEDFIKSLNQFDLDSIHDERISTPLLISDWQRQIIIGSMLGNGYFCQTGSNFFFGFSETRDSNWLVYKSQELENLSAKTPICRNGKSWRWRSQTHETWNEYRLMIQHRNRKMPVVREWLLDQLRDIGLAIWFGDRGFWYTNKRIGLRTTKFSIQSNELIERYFRRIGIGCEFRKTGKSGRIIFDQHGTKKFLATVAHCYSDAFHYKLSND